jgi:hypothetical protein
MAAIHERGEAQSQQELMISLAESGQCIDFWDIEAMLRRRGYSAADARIATADATTRQALNERCRYARKNQRRRT